ncbi:MAG TPA: type 2 lanthipeptide synthetase LanM family protein, partial [Candidatus Saccharimonadales bacterium]|nr:type 2 lanthipeptide synthetase LanM family protein [Candidatus Saccharimonadales bacterium]
MRSSPFDAPAWLRALTLAERAGVRARLKAGAPASSAELEAAAFRLREWKAQPPFDRGSWLERRLACDGLDENSFARVVGSTPDAFQAALDGSPAWLEELSEGLATGPEAARESGTAPDLPGRDAGAGFLSLVRPLVDRAISRLIAGIAPLARSQPALLPDAGRTAAELAKVLPGRLLPILDRTLVLELNVARLEGLLAGQTPEARFRQFVKRLQNRETALALLLEYPVMARLVVETLERWVSASLEFVTRLASDAGSIRAGFFRGGDPGALSGVSGGAGDPHREGRTVLILSFASGARLVYKPRPLSVDVHFQEFLRWLDASGGHPPFRRVKVLDMDTYGWIEFVEPAGCESMKEVRLYHERLGGLMAALYVLEATDLHYENLIASGDQPVPIDLESVLHPRPPRVEPGRPDERLAGRLLSHSVLRIGLLPFRVGEGDDFAGADLSGVASVGGQATPERILRWEGTGTDEMHAVRERMTMSAGRNRPTLEGREIEVSEHSNEIAHGFEKVYRLLLRHRDELLSEGSPLDAFAGDEVRAVLRPTQAYGMLLEESHHPDFLRDALDRDRFLDRLWVGVDEQPAYARVAGFEHRDLLAGDIPYFSARPGATDAWTGRGERIEGFFEASPLDVVRERLATMGEDDLRRQLWLIRTSLSTRLMGRTDDEWEGYAPVEAPPRAGSGEIRSRSLEAAGAVGDWFERMAVKDDEFITWVALDLRDQGWSLVPISEDLYAGSPGIALFLAHLGALTGESRYTGMAKAAARTLLARLDHVADSVTGVGAFQGWGGILYTLAHLGALWNDDELLRSTEPMVGRVEALATRDEDLDVVAGASGAIFALLAVHAATGSAGALTAAVRCGERLLAT